MQPEEREHVVCVEPRHGAVGALDLDTFEPAPVPDAQRSRRALHVLHPPGRNQLAHPGHRRRRGAELGAAMDVNETRGLAAEVEYPVEGGVAAAEDDEPLAVKSRGIAHTVVQLPAFEQICTHDGEFLRLERAEAGRDYHGTGEKRGVERGAHEEPAVVAPGKLCHFLSEMESRLEGLDLLQQPIDELLRAAYRQRRDVVDRLVGIELGALTARMLERVDDVRLDAEQPELEHLEQPARACTDDDGVRLDRRRRRGNLVSGAHRAVSVWRRWGRRHCAWMWLA